MSPGQIPTSAQPTGIYKPGEKVPTLKLSWFNLVFVWAMTSFLSGVILRMLALVYPALKFASAATDPDTFLYPTRSAGKVSEILEFLSSGQLS